MKKPCLLLSVFLLIATFLSASEPIQKALQPYVDNGAMPGFVTVMATADEIISVDCVGYANVEKKIPMKEDSFFWVASMTKAVAATCAMILVDEGKLDLDAPITDYLPELADVMVYSKEKDEELMDLGIGGAVSVKRPEKMMTARQCLSHMAGWRFVSPFQKLWGIDCFDHQRGVLSYAVMGLDFQPGERFHYSNVGINIVGAVIERLSGQALDQFMQERIFNPLGMTDTTFYPNEDQLSRMVTPYEYDKNNKKNHPLPQIPFITYPLSDRTKRFPEAGGGLFSTGPDFIKFYQMLAGGGQYKGKRIISEKSFTEMTRKQTPDFVENGYGFGIDVKKDCFGHGGAAGTEGTIFNNGLVTIYMVMVKDIPDQWSYMNIFNKTALSEYEKLKK